MEGAELTPSLHHHTDGPTWPGVCLGPAESSANAENVPLVFLTKQKPQLAQRSHRVCPCGFKQPEFLNVFF